MAQKKSPYFEKEMINPYKLDKCDFFIKAEHLMRYHFARDQLRNHNSKVIYDVACGNGYGTKILAQLSKTVIGFDKTNAFLSEANKIKAANAYFKQVDLDSIRLSKFISKENLLLPDAVVSFETLEHLERPDLFLEDISSLLSHEGIFFCSVPNSKYEPISNGKPKNPYHKHLFDKESIISLFDSKNLKIIDFLGQPYTNILLNLPYSSKIFDAIFMGSISCFEKGADLFAYPTKHLNNLSYSYIIVAKKK